MNNKTNFVFCLSGNVLKLIAGITMFIDHMGMLLFPDLTILRIIGRLAFPIFSFMIYEGCCHTRKRARYLLQIAILGIITTGIYYVAMKEFYPNVLITFSCSIMLIYLVQSLQRIKRTSVRMMTLLLILFGLAGLYYLKNSIIVEYGFWGIMLPVFPAVIDLFKRKCNHILLIRQPQYIGFAMGLLFLSVERGGIQLYGMLSLLLLALYNGKRGISLPKYGFYVFYPVHIAIIWLVGKVLGLT